MILKPLRPVGGYRFVFSRAKGLGAGFAENTFMKSALFVLAVLVFLLSGCSRAKETKAIKLIIPFSGVLPLKLSSVELLLFQEDHIFWQERAQASQLEAVLIPAEVLGTLEHPFRLQVKVWIYDCQGKETREASLMGEKELSPEDLEKEAIGVSLRLLISENEIQCD